MPVNPKVIARPRRVGDVFLTHLHSDPLAARAALEALSMFLAPARLCQDLTSTIQIVVAEALNNVVEHAYGPGGGPIYLRAGLSDACLEVLIRDRGAPLPEHLLFEPCGHGPDPIDLPEGGFGWHLIRRLADTLDHNRMAHWNEMKLVFLRQKNRQDTGDAPEMPQ